MYYKILGPNRSPIHGGSGPWPEPGTPTAPQPVEPCKSGYHLCRVQDISVWIKRGMELWEVEGVGEPTIADDKVVFSSAVLKRLVATVSDRQLRQFAIACAERVLERFEAAHPADKRPRKAIEAAKSYLDGKITVEELEAARSAAYTAASAAYAAYSAAFYAAYAASSAASYAASSAASAASYAAFYAASYAAYSAASYAAEREWQGNKFLEIINVSIQ